MSLEQLNILLPTYLMASCRVIGVVWFAPVLCSASVPRRIRIGIALALTLGLLPAIPHVDVLPMSIWQTSAAIAGEVVFGITLGLCANLVFVAAHWAGEMAGQQMGFTLSGLIDPQSGSQGSVVGDFYLILATVVFLLINGHHALIRGLQGTFESLPLMSVSLNRNLLDVFVGLLQSATVLSLQLAAPLLLTMLIVDIAIGVMSRVVPQMNVMIMAMSVRSAVGLVVLLLLGALTVKAFGSAMTGWMKAIDVLWTPAGGLAR